MQGAALDQDSETRMVVELQTRMANLENGGQSLEALAKTLAARLESYESVVSSKAPTLTPSGSGTYGKLEQELRQKLRGFEENLGQCNNRLSSLASTKISELRNQASNLEKRLDSLEGKQVSETSRKAEIAEGLQSVAATCITSPGNSDDAVRQGKIQMALTKAASGLADQAPKTAGKENMDLGQAPSMKDVEGKKQAVEQLAETVQARVQKLVSLPVADAGLRAQLIEAEKAKQELNQKAASLADRVTYLESQLGQSGSDRDQLEARVREAETARKQLEKLGGELGVRCANLEQQLADQANTATPAPIPASIPDAQMVPLSQFQEISSRYETAEQQRLQLQDEAANMEQQRRQLQEEASEMGRRAAALEENNKALQSALNSSQQDKPPTPSDDGTKQALIRLQSEFSSLKQQYTAAEAEYGASKESRDLLEAQLRESQENVQKAEMQKAEQLAAQAQEAEAVKIDRENIKKQNLDLLKEISALQSQVQNAQAQTAQTLSSDGEAMKQMQAKIAELQTQNAQIQNADGEVLKQMQAKIVELQSQVQNAAQTQNADGEAMKQMQAKIAELQTQNAQIQSADGEALKQMQAKIVDLQSQNAQTQNADGEVMQQMQAQIAQLQEALTTSNAEKLKAEKESEYLYSQIREKAADNGSQLEVLAAENQQLKAENAQQNAQLQGFQAQLADIQAASATIQSELDTARKAVEDKTTALSEMKKQGIESKLPRTFDATSPVKKTVHGHIPVAHRVSGGSPSPKPLRSPVLHQPETKLPTARPMVTRLSGPTTTTTSPGNTRAPAAARPLTRAAAPVSTSPGVGVRPLQTKQGYPVKSFK